MAYKQKYKNTERYRDYSREYNREYYGRTAFAENHRQRYTDYEIELIIAHSINDVALANQLGRSVRAIQQKRNEIKYSVSV